eukprot:c20869_g1_i1 orf=359-1138(+)
MVDQKASLSLQRVPARKARSERTSATSRLAWRGQNSHSWIRIDSSGNPQVLEVDRTALMKHCNLPARDLRLLDPLFVYPSTILGRQKAIVVNMERVRCIITADEVFLLNSEDNYALQYVTELQKRLALQIELAGEVSNWLSIDFKNKISVCSLSSHSRGFQASGSFNAFNVFSADKLPFEFQALEVALEATCVFLESQVHSLSFLSRIDFLLVALGASFSLQNATVRGAGFAIAVWSNSVHFATIRTYHTPSITVKQEI